MKTVLCSVLLLLVLSNITSGQSSPSNFNPNILVHSQGLPNEFLLFVPDTATQILFNPARANDYSGSFVYSTYAADFKRNNYVVPIYYNSYVLDGDIIYTTPAILHKNTSAATINDLASSTNYSETFTQGKNPTIAVATLFNALNSKWLFIFSNGVSIQKLITNYNSTSDDVDGNYLTNTSSSSSHNENEPKYETTSFRLSRISSSALGNSSMGIFASFTSNIYNYLNSSSNGTHRVSGSIIGNSYSNERSQSVKREEVNSQNVMGFEFTLAKDNWDYIARFSYQKLNYDWKSRHYTNERYIDSIFNYSTTPPTLSTSKSDRTNGNFSYNEAAPYALVFENFYQRKSTLFSLEGNLIASVNAFYSKGDGKIGISEFSNQAYYNNGVLTTKDSTSSLVDGKTDGKDWGVSFSPGYLLKKTFSNLFLMTGINLNIGYMKNTTHQTEYSSYSSNPTTSTETVKSKFVTMALPIYINYSPEDWISIWGGMNYFYGYSKFEIDRVYNTLYTSNPKTLVGNSSNSKTGYQSSKSTFLGLELKHPSGLRVQVSFDEDMASFRDWNMSVGYHF